MATIPIEVILQDAESPVDPTPTPEEETNIVVPDTGAGAIDISTFSNSSAASIIVPAVLLVLSLATVCTLLIYRHKHQGAKASKKEKLVASISTTIAVLAATALIGNLALPATKAATSDTEVSIEVPDKISIVVNREDDTTEATTEATAYITSTAAFGYKVLLSIAEGVETSNLYLDGDTTSEYYIASSEGKELEANTWGYMLPDEEVYNAIPLVEDAVTTAKGYSSVVDEDVAINYGVKVDKDLPSGTYTGEIEYTTGNAIEYMQDFADLSTENKSSVLASMTEDEQYYLKDNRDNKTYRIAKLRDGNVWMTQNLDLQKEDLLTGVILNATNTDNPVAGFELPDSQTDGDEGWESNEEDIDTIHVYDIAGNNQEYHYCLASQPWGGCSGWSEETIPTADLGNLYNWYTATAGTGVYDLGENEIAGGSICPLGWEMPNTLIEDSVSIFSNLLYSYQILNSKTIDGSPIHLNSNPFEATPHFDPSGFYNNGLLATGIVSYFWGSVASYYDKAYSPNFTESNAWLSTATSKSIGSSVRCLAR